jgi:hypothetical protein
MKIIFTLIILGILSSFTSLNAQIVPISNDTTIIYVGKGSVGKIEDTIINNGTASADITWNIDYSKSSIIAGDSINSVCFLPLGGCYTSNLGTPHLESVDPATAAFFETKFYMSALAANNQQGIIVLNTDVPAVGARVYIFKAGYPSNIAKTNKLNLTLYPQPATTNLTVMHHSNEITKAVIYSVIGSKVVEYKTPLNSNGFVIPVNQLNNGYYIMDLLDANNKSLAKKKFVVN